MSKGSVLVVEDESLVAAYASRCLESLGYRVAGVASNGAQAFSCAEEAKPDLVLMDINLEGGMDGIEAAKKIRFGLNIPVVYVTGSADDTTVEKAKAAEPLGYLLKPYGHRDLSSTIETALNQFRALHSRTKRAAQAVEEKYKVFFECSAIGVSQSTVSGQLLSANPALARILGYESPEELLALVTDLGRQLYVDSDFRRALMRELDQRRLVRQVEAEVFRKDGSRIWVSLNACRVDDGTGEEPYNLFAVEDITERRQAEQERQIMEVMLRQAQKLEAVGQLAAGIAHEINTPTQYVADNVRFLQDGFGDLGKVLKVYEKTLAACSMGEPTHELLQELQDVVKAADLEYLEEEIPKAIEQTLEGVGRVSTIVRAMKEFSHPGTGEKTITDIHKAIESTLIVCRNEYKYVADVVTDFDPALPSLRLLAGDFNQVILNLVVNAAHAIVDAVKETPDARGTISISTRRDGNTAEIRVSDTGTGIPEAVRSRIFDPFFTTKEVGKGTGQGLALARAVIVGKHQGEITFETEAGKGTTFVVRLPIE